MAEDKYNEFIQFIKQQQNIDIERIGFTLDDTFDFKCKQCGKCCDYRTDILLMPHDLYNIGRYLGRNLYEISIRYCIPYTGNDSMLPILRLNTDVVCPFLRHKKCAIDPAKPAACRLYPLGRATSPEIDYQPIYFLQKSHCGKRGNQTVRDWVGDLGTEYGTEIYSVQNKVACMLSEMLHKRLYSPDEFADLVEKYYYKYNTAKPFLPQFKENFSDIL